MFVERKLQRKILMMLTVVLLVSMFLASCASSGATIAVKPTPTHTPTPTPTPSPTPIPSPTPSPTPTPEPTPVYPPGVAPAYILGIISDSQNPFRGIPWVRLSYETCFPDNVKGAVLKNTVAQFHQQGVRVMLSLCQWATDSRLYNTAIMNDAAQGGADAVQCGNEQMKAGQYNSYVPPAIFAKFFDMCQAAMHAVRPGIPVIIGSLDPHVGGIDYYPLVQQANYLDSMQYYMNTTVHPGGHWNWRTQIVGLIDSWHNGYPGQYVNSLYGLFNFWSQQFGVNLASGALGNHLWVIEGTGCIYGCGIATDSYDVAVSHVLTLITDVQTAMRYKVPFFYFSARDFYSQGYFWPMGVRDSHDRPKPLRQDLWMGARTLTMYCHSHTVVVSSQEQLLAQMYAGCSLPGNYVGILES